ncbi:hemoglobin/transferrin/lactoferrin receptor protein [Kerstersia gyiorum]|uniref:Hemoglobin/transferrin/lactoferrin receptor protein n=1 Tax=Kerstersia gyiorum TaxID=206506 RepID=A0A4Q7MXY4_9BURK|nr:TonB-dependent receptor [Kerstersia gyiorum]RZS73961.1 hemoglobin/transferrin/lactoferrin receptor protein [Kerstersia gyiorum]
MSHRKYSQPASRSSVRVSPSIPAFRHTLISLAIAALLGGHTLPSTAYAQDSTVIHGTLELSLPAQPLTDTLTEISRLSGIQIFANGAILANLQAPAISGAMTPQQAVSRALANSGLQAMASGPDVLTIIKPSEQGHNAVTTLEEVTVIGANRHDQGHQNVYDKDITNIYLDRAYLDTYRATSPADIFQGAPGVFSGEARNSAALDPNIRNIQGQGRVPVAVDGTEQAVTVYRGYFGANNRNYIDPALISSVAIEKGPTLSRDMPHGGIGGGIAITTLRADDIIKDDQSFGAELKLETGNNATKPRINDSIYNTDYRDIPGAHRNWETFASSWKWTNLTSDAKRSGRSGFNMEDAAARLALAWQGEKYEVLAATAVRRRGNYYSGTKGADKYMDAAPNTSNSLNPWRSPFAPFIARVALPGTEVMNTSMDTTSFLLKANLLMPQEQRLGLSYRKTIIENGEIMPSRLNWAQLEKDGGLPQWPLAEVDQQAFSLDYAWNPDNNRWIDLKAQVWATRTKSDTNSSGGYAVEPYEQDDAWNAYQRSKEYHESNTGTPYTGTPVLPNPNIDGRLVNKSKMRSTENRIGIRLDNNITLRDNLSLLLSADFQHERLKPDPHYNYYTHGGEFEARPRDGKRRESKFGFNFSWQPLSWLDVNAGARYVSYASTDFEVDAMLENRGWGPFTGSDSKSYSTGLFSAWLVPLDKEMATLKALQEKAKQEGNNAIATEASNKLNAALRTKYPDTDNTYGHQGIPYEVKQVTDPLSGQAIWVAHVPIEWKRSTEGYKFEAEDNPFTNGTYDADNGTVEYYADPLNPDAAPIEVKQLQQQISAFRHSRKSIRLTSPEELRALIEKNKKRHAWAPVFSISARLTDNSRIYSRYAQSVRMPSIFEDTSGFSKGAADIGAPFASSFKPERATNIEVGYAHNLTSYLPSARHADIRFSYYHTTVKNIIDRIDDNLFWQFDKMKTSGLELQGRLDTGRWFFNVGGNYNLSQEVCDKGEALALDPLYGRIPECIEGGFPTGFLRSMVGPRYSITTDLGTRWFNDDLEIGGRLTYHSSRNQTQEAEFANIEGARWPEVSAGNRPIQWHPVAVFDAYVRYRFNDHYAMEVVGTNLSDRYYLDPLTRTMMPAPGRAVRLSATMKF